MLMTIGHWTAVKWKMTAPHEHPAKGADQMRRRIAVSPKVVAAIVIVAVCTMPAFAVDATQWGSGVFSAMQLPYSAYSLPDVWHFDITLTLQPGTFITGLAGEEQADPSLEWRFTGMQWQPGGGSSLVHFMPGSFSGWWWRQGEPTQTLSEPTWVPGAGSTYGQMGFGGKLGIVVDDDGPMYGIIAEDAAEFSNGLVIWDPNNPGSCTLTTYVAFGVDIRLPNGLDGQNMQMGWTGFDAEKAAFFRAQNSKDLTPELPPVGLLSLTMLPLGLAYWQGRRRVRKTEQTS